VHRGVAEQLRCFVSDSFGDIERRCGIARPEELSSQLLSAGSRTMYRPVVTMPGGQDVADG
jgi:hypothetical protein